MKNTAKKPKKAPAKKLKINVPFEQAIKHAFTPKPASIKK